MRYSPKELSGNVNVSKKSPLKEFFTLVSIILGILLLIYILSGIAIDIVVPHLPDEFEENLEKFYEPIYASIKTETDQEKEIQRLLNSLVDELESKKKYEVYIMENKEVNAVALPGRKILIFSGLIEEVDSEDELAFVLAHELGHFAHRDHLKALGRKIIFFAISSTLLGGNNSVNDFLGNSLVKTEMKFSQAQEKNADLFAVDLLYKKYNHAEGALSFLGKVQTKEKTPKLFYFFATHPHPQNRLKAVKQQIGDGSLYFDD